ncbi:hypothetical protein [Serratia ficaria]|uniref:hypothetical protein n=1 Tax=Serratia ficaria TaxID=61651 RepID=UPI0021C5CB98|nr:hypothetical protein [Serratia ficaria]
MTMYSNGKGRRKKVATAISSSLGVVAGGWAISASSSYRNLRAVHKPFGALTGGQLFNVAITGTSGSGKSFQVQNILRQVVVAGELPESSLAVQGRLNHVH